jgi:hypothetical protein
MSTSPLKHALEDLLRARKLRPEGPPLHGEDRRLRPLRTGDARLDDLLAGGFPRGEISQVCGPASSGRTAVALSTMAHVTRDAVPGAWVDPADSFHPASAQASGVVLPRLFWLRGRSRDPLPRLVAATSTLLGSGLFDLVVLDLVSVSEAARRALPAATWMRLYRMIAGTPTALLVVNDVPLHLRPGGVSLNLQPPQTEWAGPPGPGRRLAGLSAQAARPPLGARRVALARGAWEGSLS